MQPTRIGLLSVTFFLSTFGLLAAQNPGLTGYWDDRFGPEDAGGMGTNGFINALAVHPITGDVYAGGQLTSAGNVRTFRIGRWNGSEWLPLGGGTRGIVDALAFAPDGTLYVGGNFSEVEQADGTQIDAGNIARWDGNSWSAVGAGTSGRVSALEYDAASGNLYVGGDFVAAFNADSTTAGSAKIAYWDGASWQPMGLGLPPRFANSVSTIAVDPTSGNVAIGGQFVSTVFNADSTEIDANGLAFWDGSEWSTLEVVPNFGIDVITYNVEGTLYAGGRFDRIGDMNIGGLARFDGQEWESLGGEVANGTVSTILIEEDGLFAGGNFDEVEQPDGSIVGMQHIGFLDFASGRWLSLTDGIRSQHFPGVNAIADQGGSLFIGGRFQSAGGVPSVSVARLIKGSRSFSTTPVRFAVDTRPAQRFELIGGPWAPRPFLEVLTGDLAGTYYLSDDDEDGIYSIVIDQPTGEAVDYVFSVDRTGDAIENNDVVLELDPAIVSRRFFVTPSAGTIDAPVVVFDDRDPFGPPSNAIDNGSEWVWTGRRAFLVRGSEVNDVAIDVEQTDRTLFATIWETNDNPGVAPPEGVERIARNTLWRLELWPAAAQYMVTLEWDYSEMTGIAEPIDLVLLHRPHPDSVWNVVPTEVDLNDELLLTPDVASVSGEWTVGSANSQNVLTDRLPGIPANPRPGDGVLAAPVRPTLRWDPVAEAGSYDVYLWPATEAEPASPVANVDEPAYTTSVLQDNTEYNWKIVALNINGSTSGSMWSFRVGQVPDLEVTSVEAPTATFSGQQIEISWTVSNGGDGSTNVPRWDDGFYLSTDASFDAESATRIGFVQNLSVLGSGDQYANQSVFTLPRGIEGTYHVHAVADAKPSDRGALDESDESNNTASSAPIAVTLEPFADLEVSDVIKPDLVFSGDSIDVTWTVENNGTGQTDRDEWIDTIFLSDDDVFNSNFAINEAVINILEEPLATFRHTGALEAGESYTVTRRIKVPDDAIGDFHLFVYTDIGGGGKQPEAGDVYEFNQEFDNWTGEAINITLTPPPDLTVADVSGFASAKSGQTVTLEWTVRNSGPGATKSGSWGDAVYYSATSVFDSLAAIPLSRFIHTGDLNVDETYEVSGEVRIPDGVLGDAYLFVSTDWSDRVFEHTFEDNNRASVSQPVEVELAPYPDLMVENVGVTPTATTAGRQVALSYDVVNRGTAAATRSWTDSLMASNEPRFDRRQAIRVGKIDHGISRLDVDESQSVTTAVRIPAEMSGSVYLFVVPDAKDEIFEYPDDPPGIGLSPVIQVGSYPPVNLQAQLADVPDEASSGQQLDVSLMVTNVGSARTLAGAWTDVLFLSADETIDPDEDRELLRIDHEGHLQGGESYTRVRSLTLPQGVSGPHHLIFKADFDQVVAETSDNNNSQSAPIQISLSPAVDLRIANVEVADQLTSGEPTPLSWIVDNAGDGAIEEGTWYDAVYLSQNQRRDRDDVLVTTQERHGPLSAGGSYEVDSEVVLPAYAAGPLYLLFVPDLRNDVYEHLAEGNNLRAEIVELILPAPADLEASEVVGPTSAQPGQEVTVEWTVANVGSNPARGRIREGVFVSNDDEWSADDVVLGVRERTIDLDPGASGKSSLRFDVGKTFAVDASGNITDRLPGLSDGTYRLIVRTDLGNTIRETSLANNLAVAAANLEVGLPALPLGDPLSFTAAEGESRYFTVTVGQGEDLYLSLTSDVSTSGNEVYVAVDRTPTAGGDFDWAAAEPLRADQELIVPSRQGATYHVLVLARSLPEGSSHEQLTLTAEGRSFSVSNIEPDRAGDRGETTVVVSGARFSESSQVFLHREGADSVQANLIVAKESTELRARIPTAGMDLGTWDLIVTNDSDQTLVVDGGFTIEEADPPGLTVELVGPEAARVRVPTPFRIVAYNPTNVNVERVAVSVRIPKELRLLDVQDPDGAVSPFLDLEEDVVVEDDGLSWFMFFILDLRPEATETLRITLQADEPASRGLAVNFTEYTRSQLFWAQLNAESEAARLGEAEFPVDDENSTGKFLGTQDNLCDPCKDLERGLKEECEIRKKKGYYPGVFEDLAKEGLGGGPRSPKPGLWKKLFCAPTGVDPCSDDPPPPMPCFCNNPSDCLPPDFPPWLNPFDPNEMIGPQSFGSENWVSIERELNYTIRFENDPDLATAPAQVVDIRQRLDADLDERNFRLGPYGFGQVTFNPPGNVAHFSDRLHLSDSLGFDLDVTAGLNVISNEVFWNLKTIDPTTGDQPITDPFAGFLPVNDTTDAGQGFVSYTILADSEAETSAKIDAQASIVFDSNAPIETPPIFNTIDAEPPVSTLNVLAGRQDSTVFEITWSGRDEGSGIRNYTLYASTDGGPFEAVETAVTDTASLFVGELGHRYQFFTIATDNAGNEEPFKTGGRGTIVSVDEDEPAGIPKEFALHQNYPNPFNPTTTIPFDLPENGQVQIALYDILGRQVLTVDKGDLRPGKYQHLLNLSEYASGVYLYRIVVKDQKAVRFTDVGKLVLVK